MVDVRVGVVGGDDIFRRGLVSCLGEEPGIDVVPATVPDLDVVVVTSSGSAEVAAGVPVVLCTDEESDRDALASSVAALLPRATLSAAQLVAAVRAAAAGLHVLAGNGAGAERRPVLAERELQVLRCLADGMGTRDISRRLGYSERTIKSTIARACDRLGTRTRAQAVAESYRMHLL